MPICARCTSGGGSLRSALNAASRHAPHWRQESTPRGSPVASPRCRYPMIWRRRGIPSRVSSLSLPDDLAAARGTTRCTLRSKPRRRARSLVAINKKVTGPSHAKCAWVPPVFLLGARSSPPPRTKACALPPSCRSPRSLRSLRLARHAALLAKKRRHALVRRQGAPFQI